MKIFHLPTELRNRWDSQTNQSIVIQCFVLIAVVELAGDHVINGQLLNGVFHLVGNQATAPLAKVPSVIGTPWI